MKYLCLFLTLVPVLSLAQVAPTKLINGPLKFDDDLNFVNFKTAVKRHLKYFDRRRGLGTEFKLGSTIYTRNDLKVSLVEFDKMIDKTLECQKENSKNSCMNEFSKEVNDKFLVYQPIPKKDERGYKADKTFFTTYYSPSFEGSFTKTKKFKIPVYAKPKDAELQNLSRVEIDFDGKLTGKGLELIYLDTTLYDQWLMHVEGGARVFVNESGERKTYYLSYNGKNNRSFRMLVKYMVKQGMLPPDKSDIAHQRRYFASHPERAREILEYCPSYIYFKLTKTQPVGVHNIPLTDNRSLATDYRIYKEYGLLTFVKMKKPVMQENGEIKRVPFSRFFVNQDTGGAIRGNARSDLYFGHGPEAELAARKMSGLGDQYFLMLKRH